MLRTSEGLINRDLIYITSLTKKNWAIRSQQGHTKGSLCRLTGHNSLANSSALHSQQGHIECFLCRLTGHNSLANSFALLALKQKVGFGVFFVNT